MMRNFKNKLLMLVAVGAVVLSCKDDDDGGSSYRISVSEIIYGSDCKTQAVEGATVKLYATEEDYLFDENVVAETKSDNVGRALFNVPAKTYWFRAFNETYNDYRSVLTNGNQVTEQDKLGVATLGPTPVQLQLNLKDENGTPLGADYQVELFYNEADFTNNVKAHESTAFAYSNKCLNIAASKISDSEGTVMFPNLEAKEYWFKVRRINTAILYLQTSIVKTPSLPDNKDIVTALDVIVDLP